MFVYTVLHRFHPNLQPPNKALIKDYILDLAMIYSAKKGSGGGEKHKYHLLFKEVSDDHQEKGIWNRYVQMGSFNKDEPIMVFEI